MHLFNTLQSILSVFRIQSHNCADLESRQNQFRRVVGVHKDRNVVFPVIGTALQLITANASVCFFDKREQKWRMKSN